MRTLADIGERELIKLASAIYKEHDDSVDLTDDCAIIPINDDFLLVTSDMISEKTHIPKGMTPWQIGWFITAINLSDIAAKGGSPLGILLSIGLPKTYSEQSFLDLIKGASSCAKRYDTSIIGGDTKEQDQITISGTAIGRIFKERFMSRKGAEPGDLVAVTGNVGKAAAGFYQLKEKINSGSINALCEPTPRLIEGKTLAETNKVHCCMDLSDGISSSLYQLAELNKIGFEIDQKKIPVSPVLDSYVKKDSSLDKDYLALHYGGDYELLITADSDDISFLQGILESLHTPLTIIGRVVQNNNINLIAPNQSKTILLNLGYQHFTNNI